MRLFKYKFALLFLLASLFACSSPEIREKADDPDDFGGIDVTLEPPRRQIGRFRCQEAFQDWADYTVKNIEATGGRSQRGVYLDSNIPSGEADLPYLGCQAIMLATAITADKSELPIKLKFIDTLPNVQGRQEVLHKIGCAKESFRDPRLEKLIGPYSQTCFYVTSISRYFGGVNINADWARNRKDMVLSTSAPLEAVSCVPSDKKPTRDLYREIIKTQFCMDLE